MGNLEAQRYFTTQPLQGLELASIHCKMKFHLIYRFMFLIGPSGSGQVRKTWLGLNVLQTVVRHSIQLSRDVLLLNLPVAHQGGGRFPPNEQQFLVKIIPDVVFQAVPDGSGW
jgi:hypothetical protein